MQMGGTSGIGDVVVRVFDVDGLVGEDGEDLLGEARTGADGRYEVTYEPSSYGALEFTPDLVVRLYDSHLRLLYESSEAADVSAETHLAADIWLHENDVNGHAATNAVRPPESGSSRGTAEMLTGGNRVRFYVDNDVAWADFIASIDGAASFVNVTQLYTDPQNMIAKFEDGYPVVGSPSVGTNVERRLKAAAERDVAVRLVLNFPDDGEDSHATLLSAAFYPLLQNRIETYRESIDFFQSSTVEIRAFHISFISPMHAKIAIVDGREAWLFGSPLTQQSFDTPPHPIDQMGRGILPEFSGTFGVPFPFHDVSIRIVGPAVRDLDKTFELIWGQADPLGTSDYTSTIAAPPADLPSGEIAANWSPVSLQVIRTLPGNRTGRFSIGETSVLESYQRAIREASDFIYIEDQYLWAPDLLESLKYAIGRDDGPQIILVGNLALDVPGYQGKQDANLKDLLKFARDRERSDRLGLFTTWLHETGTPKSRIIPLYIHSKVAIIDDAWATVGSANLDGNSLNVASTTDFIDSQLGISERFGPPVQHATDARVRQPPRNVEVNVAMLSGIAGQPASTAPRVFRELLWKDHLGLSSLPSRPSEGWLKLWRDAANAKHSGLQADTPTVMAARALPWRFANKTKCYMKALEVDRSRIDVLKRVRSFNLTEGRWVD
jgi:phosphatidylserine/phosphatidylglycerophosphate/cardiolipin synthase-like enzyme